MIIKRTKGEETQLINEIYKECFNITNVEDELKYDSTSFTNLDLDEAEIETDKYIIEAGYESHGGEGQGEDYWSISKITIKETWEELFVKFDGYYNSWDWVEWSDWSIVEPREVKVTQFFSKY